MDVSDLWASWLRVNWVCQASARQGPICETGCRGRGFEVQ